MGGRQRAEGIRAALIAALLLSGPDRARSGDRLVLTNGSSVDASLAAIDYDAARPEAATFRFAIDDGEPTAARGLVRWGAPAPAAGGASLTATDGSVLVSDRAWSASGYLRVDGDSVSLHRKSGWLSIERTRAVRATLDAFDETAGEEPGADDSVRLVDGDRLDGRVEEVTRSKLTLLLAGADETIEAPVNRVAELRFGRAVIDRPRACCLIGLADGSLLRAERVRTADDRFSVSTHSGIVLDVERDNLVFAQPIGGAVEYLSDRDPVDYRHTPYFDVRWPYARDADLSGGPLRAGGRRHAKGVAVRSASRLVYRLDGEATRFQAEAAIADQATGGVGSVVFRVYLVRGDEVEPAFSSEVVRGGDEPTPIDVDASGASAVVLVVDYADDGDAGDEALWLDARLVD